jgi:hypothetical protein
MADHFDVTNKTAGAASLMLKGPLDRENATEASFKLSITAYDCTGESGGCQNAFDVAVRVFVVFVSPFLLCNLDQH